MYNKYMIKNELRLVSTTSATSLDITENIKTSCTVIVQNINSSGFIYLGNYSITTSKYGFKLYPGQGITIELNSWSTLYAIASAPNMSVAVMEIDRAI